MPGPLPPLPHRAEPSVMRNLAEASRRSGVDFRFLVAQADMESGLDTKAKAETSSAAGLFQFIEQTWLGLMREHGERLGFGNLSRAIEGDRNGRLRVADPAMRQRLLDLRHDGRVAADLGAEYARGNADRLENVLGRQARPTEIYLAHFLGPGGAAQFLKARAEGGETAAASLLPQAAQANRSVFFDSSGHPRSLDQVYGRFEAKLAERMAQFGGAQKTENAPATDRAPIAKASSGEPAAISSPSRVAQSRRIESFEANGLADLPTTWLLFALGVLPGPREAENARAQSRGTAASRS